MSKLGVLLIGILLSSFVYADEAKELFDEAKCMECHNNSDFGGDTSKSKSYKEVHDVVIACQMNNDAGWFDEDSELVTDYLNNKFYKFKKK